eukprot:291839_1
MGNHLSQQTVKVHSRSCRDLRGHASVPIVQKTWTLLIAHKDGIGDEIRKLMFKTDYPLFEETSIKQQIIHLMEMIEEAILMLSDIRRMDDKLKELGELHINEYGIQSKHLKYFREIFLQTIRKYLPWNERREYAWCWFLQKIIFGMCSVDDTSLLMNAHKMLMLKFDINQCISLVDGYIGRHQRLLNKTVPVVVNTLCLKFYHTG